MRKPRNLLVAQELEAFLAERTEVNDLGCMVWQRSVQGGGYAQVAAPWGRAIGVHRLVYLVFVGPLREDLEVHHKCGVRRCCNPEHLEALSDISHKRADANWVGNRTHCKRGHPLDGDNLSPAMLKRGIRRCKTCTALKMREARAVDPNTTRREAREAMKRWLDKDRQRNRDYQRERRKRLKAANPDPT